MKQPFISTNRIMSSTEAFELAKYLASKSTCLRRKYGAVILDQYGVKVSEGYNSVPERCTESCVTRGYCERERQNVPKGERYELCLAVHAEQKALIHADGNRLHNAEIYIVGFEQDGSYADGHPCLICDRMIRESGIKKINYITKTGKPAIIWVKS